MNLEFRRYFVSLVKECHDIRVETTGEKKKQENAMNNIEQATWEYAKIRSKCLIQKHKGERRVEYYTQNDGNR